MQGKQLVSTFFKSIGKLEHFIQTLENNVGVFKTTSPLVQQHGVLQQDLDKSVQAEKQAHVQKLINQNNENVKYFDKQQNPEEEPQEQQKPQKKQQKPQKQKQPQQDKKQEAKKQPEQQQNKKEKPQKQKKGNQPQPQKEFEPTPEWFYQMDIRVGNITEVQKHPESEKLYCEKIDIGGEVRSIASGLQQFVPIEQMTGLCLVMTNLKPMKMAGFESNGMVLCTSLDGPERKVELLRPPAGSQVGQRVTLENHAPESEEKPDVMNPKKKLLVKALPYFKSDENLYATFNGYKWTLPSGLVQSTSIKNGTIG